MKKKTGEKIEINRLKNILYEEYTHYIKTYPQQIVNILIAEGKKTLGDQVNSNMLSFSSFIYSDNYFLTVLDIWLLVNKYKIPTFFISTKNLLQTNYEKNIFLGYGNMELNEHYCFIIVPSLLPESIPIYKVVTNDKNEIFIPMKEFKNTCNDEIKIAFENKKNIENYLKDFIKISKPVKKRMNIKISIEDDGTEE